MKAEAWWMLSRTNQSPNPSALSDVGRLRVVLLSLKRGRFPALGDTAGVFLGHCCRAMTMVRFLFLNHHHLDARRDIGASYGGSRKVANRWRSPVKKNPSISCHWLRDVYSDPRPLNLPPSSSCHPPSPEQANRPPRPLINARSFFEASEPSTKFPPRSTWSCVAA